MNNDKKLNADDLNIVTGGLKPVRKVQKMMIECPKCGAIFAADVMKSSVKCEKCPYIIEIKG